MNTDAVINVEFLTTEEGGRTERTPADFFGCIFMLNNENYDCRLLLNEYGAISPGDKVKVPIKFLNSEIVMGKIKEGVEFDLWDGKIIARGIVDSLS